ncbi:ureidoglycolate dehydrogenase (NAD(+))-like [Anticarsia gemmatalis]|uniref:ureidoglycolate dehydrogenase (NAD(+))-like n=1 Tax=Anticarsia gemmatalis TaxID=129554 RepID=UPI003F77330F
MAKVQIAEVRRFIIDCLRALGTKPIRAADQAELLIYADKLGLPNHGLHRLDSYVYAIESGVCEPNSEPEILNEKSSTACVDPRNVMGATTGHFAMDLAINMANETGVGWVTVKGLNHSAEPFSFWTLKAADHGLIGKAFRSISPAVPAPFATQQVDIMSDLLPPGEALAQDRRFGMRNAALLSHADTTNNEDESVPTNPDHCFVAINPVCFATGFDGRLTNYNQHWSEMDPTDPKLLEVTLGDMDDIISKVAYESGDEGSLAYKMQQINSSIAIAQKLKVKHMNLE